MRLRWLIGFSLVLLLCAASASASRRADLPTSGGGVLNDCSSPHGATGLYFSKAPVVSLTPITVNDSVSGNTYTVHVDAYDWGNMVCNFATPVSPPSAADMDNSEIRTSGTYTILVVYVDLAGGTTPVAVDLNSFEIAKILTNPDFNVCEGGWTYCNTSINQPDEGGSGYPLLQPAASPGADGSNTVWSFGIGLDLGPNSEGPFLTSPLNRNANKYFGGVVYGSSTLVAGGTVACQSGDGPCNSISTSTPYRLTFTPPGDTAPVTVSSLPAIAFTSAAGHDSSSNPIVITGGSFQGLYDASGNYPTLTDGQAVDNRGVIATGNTFTCAGVSSSPVQQYRSVFFNWVAPASGPVNVSTAGSHYDTILSVTGGSVQACNDDNDPSGIGVVTSSLAFQAVSGTTYQFLVTEYPPLPQQLEAPSDEEMDTYIGPLSGDSTLYFTLSTPQLTPAPASFTSFGPVTMGTTSPGRTIQLTSSTANFGSTGITNVTATASGDFHVTPASCATPVPDSNPCVLTVTFTPTAVGTRNGTLTITSGGANPAEDTPISFALTGTGTAPGPVNVTTTGGTNGYAALFSSASTVVNSVVQQYNGSVGIGRVPSATLDVNGKSIFRGGMDMSRVGDATPSVGATSSPLQMQSSVYNSSSKINVLPYFQLETEPMGNNTASTGAALHFLYYSGVGSAPGETGMYINPNGTIHFATGQTFPGTAPAARVGVSSALSGVSSALVGERGSVGPAGPAGPAGMVGPNLAVSGGIAATRGFFSMSADASVAQFAGSSTADNAVVMALTATGKSSYGLLTRSAYVGLYAQGAQYAARFNGALATDSLLSSSGASYKIDDPLDAENESLAHATVSSPERMNLYNGIVVTDANGNATVTMPKYFEALNRDFQYQLTVIGQFSKAVVATRIANGVFTVKTEKPNVKVSWQVTGIRQDAWANAHPAMAEEAKPNAQRQGVPSGPGERSTVISGSEPASLRPEPAPR